MYLAGQNELAPEMERSLKAILEQVQLEEGTVIIQIGLENREILTLLRPSLQKQRIPAWEGVRRYVYESGHEVWYEQLGTVDMASPVCFAEFLTWAVSKYWSRHCLLALAGHVYQFVGMCPDYSGKSPKLLGFPEIAQVIQQVFSKQGRSLEVLLLDTCYAGTVEIIYEFAQWDQPVVQMILTYIGKSPLSGFCYGKLLETMSQYSEESNQDLGKYLIRSLNPEDEKYELAVYEVNHKKYEAIKLLLDSMMREYQEAEGRLSEKKEPRQLLSECRIEEPWSYFLIPMYHIFDSLVFTGRKKSEKNGVLPIHLLTRRIQDQWRCSLYRRLAFAKENGWADWLCGVNPPLPRDNVLRVSNGVLKAFLTEVNAELSSEQIDEMMKQLFVKKRWKNEKEP